MKESTIITRVILILFIIASGLVLWKWELVSAYIQNGNAAEQQQSSELGPVIRVITTPVRITSNDIEFETMGSGRALQSVMIYPAVSEEITSVHFDAGDKVSAGDVLVQLDDREEKLAVQRAAVNLKNARSLLDRYQLAVKEGAVPESEVDSAQARVDVAQVELDQAELELEERKIRAPFSGVVGLPRVDPGERVDPNTPITSLDNRSSILVDFDVPEELAVVLQNEHSISAHTPAYPNQIFQGTIEALESRIDAQNRTIKARAKIDNSNDILRPGMSFMTTLEIHGPEYPTVPEISLQWGREGSFVWIIRDGIAYKEFVRVVARTAGEVLVEGEIKENELVVVEGVQRVRPRSEVIATDLSQAYGNDSESGDS